MSNLKELHNKECCPKFNQEKWDEKTFDWDHKQFIKESVPTFFHIPLPPLIAKKIKNMMKMAEGSKKLESTKKTFYFYLRTRVLSDLIFIYQ